MKKLASVISIFIAVFVLSVTAFASEIPDFELPVARMFKISHEDDFSPEEVYNYALENGFNGILLDLRGSDSTDLYGKYLEISNNIQYFEYYVIIEEKHLDPLPKPGKHFVFTNDISEEAIAEYSKVSGSECLSFLLPFGDEKALETAKYFYGKGYFKTVFVENLLSCYSEYGYEQYLLDISKNFPGAKIITINDLGRVLVPVVRGDFFGDTFELCNQYLVNKINGFGFCVSDYSELIGNRNPAAGALISSFKNTVLDEYANFSVPEKLEITRPTGSSLNVSTEKYTIFRTSDPSKPLYMNGEEVERISQSGLFAVTVNVSKKAKTFTFSQGNISDSVKIKLGGENTGTSGTTKKLSSCYPSSAEIIKNGETSVTLSCVGPSGGKVSAKIGETKVSLEQVAYADSGVPARFKGTIDLSGEYSENEVTGLGRVTYTLSYNGNVSTYESSSEIYYVGENADFAIRANVELSGVEKAPEENGDYLTTLRTGCVDYVTEITENGWYKISCGGFMKPSQFDILTGEFDITSKISSAEREIGGNYEKLVFSSSSIPAFKGEINGKIFSITLFNTEWSDFSSTDFDSNLMYRINSIDNCDGSITVNFFSKTELWGWDFFTDPENGTFSVALKGKPRLSDNISKPLSGITVAVCAGHGGPDPGALSVVGEQGIYESEINLANALAISESLENLGAKIVLLVTEDEKMDTYARTDPARYAYSDVYICCHANSVAENAAANLWCGTYVYYHYDHSADFAKRLCDYISASTKRDNEGSEQGYYSVTRLTMCPAVMLEVGFVSNPKELESLIDKRDIQKTALAVTKAVLEICDN